MKKLITSLALVVCLLASTFPAFAGDVEFPGVCDSQACVAANTAPEGWIWALVDGLWHLTSIV